MTHLFTAEERYLGMQKVDNCLRGAHSYLEMRALGFNWKCVHWHGLDEADTGHECMHLF